MTDEQIIKALKYCNTDVRENTCPKCAFYKKHRCSTLMLNAVSDLINRQKAEIENLKVELKAMRGAANSYKLENERLLQKLQQAKSEAKKEFAEKIKQRERIMKYDLFPKYAVSVKDIDDIVKEMTEADK